MVVSLGSPVTYPPEAVRVVWTAMERFAEEREPIYRLVPPGAEHGIFHAAAIAVSLGEVELVGMASRLDRAGELQDLVTQEGYSLNSSLVGRYDEQYGRYAIDGKHSLSMTHAHAIANLRGGVADRLFRIICVWTPDIVGGLVFAGRPRAFLASLVMIGTTTARAAEQLYGPWQPADEPPHQQPYSTAA